MPSSSSATPPPAVAKKHQLQKKDAVLLRETFQPYLAEIGLKLRSVGVVFAVSAGIGFFYYQKILLFLISLFHFEGVNLVLTSPYQWLDLSIQTGIITGVVVTSPLFFYQLIQFIKPALQPKEYAVIIRLLPISIGLFVIGFGFGVWVLQFVITLFTETTTQLAVNNIWDISSFVSQVLVMGLSLAFVFQMPIVITSLLKLKIVSYQTISSKRRIVYVAIFIIAALLPPTDIVSLSLLSVVPLFLFESALLFNRPRPFTLGRY